MLGDLPRVIPQPPELDDHAALKEARAVSPVGLSPIGVPLALRHRHMGAMINPETTRQVEVEGLRFMGIEDGVIDLLFRNGMLTSNGAAHVRRRKPVQKTFAFKMIAAMRDDIRAVAESFVERRVGTGPIDFTDMAGAFPAFIIARILGIPEDDVETFRHKVYQASPGISNRVGELRTSVEEGFGWLFAYADELIGERRRAPKDDFLTRLLDDPGTKEVSADELRAQVITLIVAGADTTRTALSATFDLLLRHPEQWRALCEAPEDLKRKAAAEGLRYQPSVAGVGRFTTADVELDGVTVPAGNYVALSLLSMMRDEDVYRDPDSFDIHREDHPRWHPVFGGGAHRCLGEALAWIEMEEMLSALARLAPGSELTGERLTVEGLAGIRKMSGMGVELLG